MGKSSILPYRLLLDFGLCGPNTNQLSNLIEITTKTSHKLKTTNLKQKIIIVESPRLLSLHPDRYLDYRDRTSFQLFYCPIHSLNNATFSWLTIISSVIDGSSSNCSLLFGKDLILLIAPIFTSHFRFTL